MRLLPRTQPLSFELSETAFDDKSSPRKARSPGIALSPGSSGHFLCPLSLISSVSSEVSCRACAVVHFHVALVVQQHLCFVLFESQRIFGVVEPRKLTADLGSFCALAMNL